MKISKFFVKENNSIIHKEFQWDSETSPVSKEQFLTAEEIINDLLTQRLNAENTKILIEMTEDNLIMLHHGFGTWIRNNYGLWLENNPYVDKHPDDYCFDIIKELHSRLQNTITVIDDTP